jgi:hypothetical protein
MFSMFYWMCGKSDLKYLNKSDESSAQIGAGEGNRTLVISLEDIRELQSLNAHSDKTALKRRFDHKQLISPVRTHNIVAQHPPRAGTVVPSLAPDLRQSA